MFDDKLFLGLFITLISALVSWLFKSIFNRLDKGEEAIHRLAEMIENKNQSKELARETNKGINDKLDSIAEQ